jgi:hypothetical protein
MSNKLIVMMGASAMALALGCNHGNDRAMTPEGGTVEPGSYGSSATDGPVNTGPEGTGTGDGTMGSGSGSGTTGSGSGSGTPGSGSGSGSGTTGSGTTGGGSR